MKPAYSCQLFYSKMLSNYTYNFSLLRKGQRVVFEVKDANMHVQVDVPTGMYMRTRTECGLQGHILCAHLGRWTASWSHQCLPGHRPLGSKDAPLSASPSTTMPEGKLLSSAPCCHVSPTRSGRVIPPSFDFSLSPCTHLFGCLSEFGFCTCGRRGRPMSQCMCTRIKKGHPFPGLQHKGLITFQNNWSYKLMGHLKCYLVPNIKCSNSALRGH